MAYYNYAALGYSITSKETRSQGMRYERKFSRYLLRLYRDIIIEREIRYENNLKSALDK